MCGIAGILNRTGKAIDAIALQSMGRTIGHRGPDNFGWTTHENIGVVHTRLSFLDLSDLANQPYQNEHFILTYNGEIYNFRQIRQRLETEFGIKFKTTSDTEVLFHSLINDGVEGCLSELRGMFAFAFYDKREGELTLARDRLGIKPLYYIDRGDSFYFASEMKVLSTQLDMVPDPTKTLIAIGGLGERSRRNTLFEGLYSLEPGSYVKVTAGGRPQRRSYYDPISDFDLDYYRELERANGAAIISEFSRLFTDSVERMLVSDVPMGAFVSGGVDSSLIAAVAAKQYPDIHLFTANVVGNMSEYDDARTVSQHINAKLSDYRFEPEMFLRDWVETTYFYESPIVVHTNSVPFGNVAKVARESGVKAVLTGEGADELFLGYPRLLTQRYNRLARFPDTILKSVYKLVPGLHEYLFANGKSNLMNFVGNLAQNFESQRLDEQDGQIASLDGVGRQAEQRMTIKMLNEHLVTLLHRNDRMGMMNSIEARFPFLDEAVVKFAINLPSKFKIGRSSRFHNYKHPFLIDKWIVRKLAEGYLPKKIVYKKKFGFGMMGHKHVSLKSDFFKNGWLADVLKLDSSTLEYLVSTQDRYFIAKLASVEIFGRIFARRDDRATISRDVMRHASLRGAGVAVN
jgi:asparagine synthase (glutamine-hydrolysing)